ncbi:MAG: hypothetical protein JSS02_33660 [Planctomycetes bacterium]|nr:hypothetical protein [Planctomycetota bacterium]
MQTIQILADEIERERISRARNTPPAEKFLVGIRLFESSCRLIAAGVRQQFPDADESQVAEIVRQRLEIARRLETDP